MALDPTSAIEFGRVWEEFAPGAVYQHWPGKTVTEYDHHLFCLVTMAHHPIHIDANFAEVATRHKVPLVIGSYLFSLLIGLSEADIAGKAISHRGFDEVRHYRPVMHGDTIYAESEVLAKTELPNHDDRGAVKIETRGRNQHGVVVMSFLREMIIPKAGCESQAKAEVFRRMNAHETDASARER